MRHYWNSLEKQGHFESTVFIVYISGVNKTDSNGVAILQNQRLSTYVEGYKPVNDRLILITIKATPVKQHILQVCFPTANASEKHIEIIYETIETE